MLKNICVGMFCNTNQFISFKICGSHTKPYVVRGLSKHFHI